MFLIDGSIDRHYYEMAVLTELRNLVRSGNVSITGSRQHQDFEEYLISKDQWEKEKYNNRLVVPPSVEDYLSERMESLQKRLTWITANISDIEGLYMYFKSLF
ncbi:hypothetical protein P4T70_12135 [Bacillus mobilis]|nr:hypothetical protein [Bacillus mobilis]MED1003028.1 hypothetical protein [Bacillus mobilis]